MPPPAISLFGQVLSAATWGTELDLRTKLLLGVVLGLLIAGYIIARLLRRQPDSTIPPAVLGMINKRLQAWLLMCAILVAGFLMGYAVTIVLFGLVSFWALREFITMTPTRRGDHRALFWTFFLFTPLQYLLVGLRLYEFSTVMIPVYASLVIPARIALSDDPKRFLERVAKIQAGLLICVYALSHAPALLSLELTRSDGSPWIIGASPAPAPPQPAEDVSSDALPMPDDLPPPAAPATGTRGSNAGLLFFFALIVQLNDALQFAWGKLLGKHVIAPSINASRTWEGFIGEALTTMLVGSLLYWATPFWPWESACMALAAAVMGFAGSMTMSAIKRDRGVTDYGTLVQGHAGVLDRIDSLCFAAPIFFHLTRLFFTSPA